MDVTAPIIRDSDKVYAALDETDPGRIHITVPYSRTNDVKTLLAVRWNPGKKTWVTPLSWSACVGLRSTFGPYLEISPELTEWARKERTEIIDPANKLVTATDLKAQGLTELNHATREAVAVGDKIGLFEHQVAGAAYMATTKSCIIADETGTGKSAQAIAALRTLHRMGAEDIFPVLVVTPSSVKTSWDREFKQWWPGLTVVKVEGSAVARRKQLETPAHVYIANWEQLPRHSRLAGYGNIELKRCTECGGLDETVTVAKCQTHEREFNMRGFKSIIADEAHRAKSPSSQSTRALWALADKANYRFGLTGTPVQDNIDDLWALLRYTHPKEFPAKTKFIERYAETGFNSWGIHMILGMKEDAQDEYWKIMHTQMRRMLKKVVLPFLPPIMFEDRYVPMTGAQRKAYKDMEKNASVSLGYKNVKEAREDKKELTIDGELVTTTPLAKNTRLLQFASAHAQLVSDTLDDDGEAFVDTESDDFAALELSLPSNKVAEVLSMIENGDLGDSSVVIFAQSRQLINLLSTAMDDKKIAHGLITGGQNNDQRQDAIDDFQGGKIKYILVTIAAGGVGLTLTKADTMLFMQRSYSSIGMRQAMSRAHRIGSEMHDSVTIINVITEDSIEEDQIEDINAKFKRSDALLGDSKILEAAGITE